MAEYHVGCGMSGIYAGTLKKGDKEWRAKSLVTEEAINAVRDWLLYTMKNGDKTHGYAWDMKDGRTLNLVVTIHDKEDVNHENN